MKNILALAAATNLINLTVAHTPAYNTPGSFENPTDLDDITLTSWAYAQTIDNDSVHYFKTNIKEIDDLDEEGKEKETNKFWVGLYVPPGT